MSVRAVNLYVPPDVHFIQQALTVEEKPIYTGIRLKRSGSGVRSYTTGTTTLTETLAYSREKTLTRVGQIAAPALPSEDWGRFLITDRFPSTIDPDSAWSYESAGWAERGVDECHMVLLGALYGTPAGGISPRFQALTIIPNVESEDGIVIGSRETDNAGTITTADVILDFPWTPPAFYRSQAAMDALAAGTDYRPLVDRWGYLGASPAEEAAIDLTAWTFAEWHDMRGIRTITVPDPLAGWDSNTVTHAVEWELF